MTMIKGTTKILGIIGDPVTYSLSPVMHNAVFQYLDLDYAYIPLPLKSEALATGIQGLGAIASMQGFNVTIPHKEAVLPFLSATTTLAQTLGAVNTVKRTEQGWLGTNTDVHGFLQPLQALERDWQTISVVVLGSGGAAKAVVTACQQLGCGVIHLVGRDHQKMKQFYHQLNSHLPQLNLRLHPWASVDSLLEVAGLVVNTTPLGMASQPESPLSLAQLKTLTTSAIVYDLIYTPRPTQLLQMAQTLGLTPIDGLGMLLHQGVAALEFWLDQTLSPEAIAVMEKSLLEACTT
ncbi:MAG: shikimate dehydrogenase [Pseudanabaenaceae cyanobacterium]